MLNKQHGRPGALPAVAALAAGTLLAQTGARPVSYVASVKPNGSPEARTFMEYYPGGRLSAVAVTVRGLLRNAYHIQDYQLAGAPPWFSTKRYDISAKTEDNPPSLPVFLQTLLADRFKLAVHSETRELPRFALVLTRRDGKPGPQLVRSDFDCAAYFATSHPLANPALTPPCGTRIGMGELAGKSILMSQLATGLAPFVNRFVHDMTGLTGRFDVTLTWAPERASPDFGSTAAPDSATGDSGRPSLFTALQEQLGVRLVAERGPVDVLVIDRAQEPMPD